MILTPDGLKELKAEYDVLVKTKRPVAVARLSDARSLGDLSENAEYVEAKKLSEWDIQTQVTVFSFIFRAFASSL